MPNIGEALTIYPLKEQANFKIEFDYKNYKNETSHRKVLVQNFQFSSSEWHKEPQWLLRGFDLEKQEFRDFAMKDMTNVKEIKPPYHKSTVQDALDFYGF